MIYVLNIGRYGNEGKFGSNTWKELFFWLSEKNLYINLYTYCEEDVQEILKSCLYDILPYLDESKSLIGFHLTKLTKETITLIQNYPFSINGGIQFLFFGTQNRILMEIQIEDWNNFVILYLEEIERLEILKYITNISANQKICELFRNDITELVGEIWEPLR